MRSKIVGAVCAAFAMFVAQGSSAQQGRSPQAMVVSSCGNQAFPTGTTAQPKYSPFTILPSGLLCTNATGGGGGGSVTQGTSPWVDSISGPLGPALGPANAVGIVLQDGQTTTLSGSGTGALFNSTYPTGALPTAGYQSFSVQIQSAGSGNTWVYEQSNDGSIWYPAYGVTGANSGTVAPSNTDTAVTLRIFPANSTYFRIRISVYGSGGVIAAVTQKTTPIAPIGVFATLAAGSALIGDISTGYYNGAQESAASTGVYTSPRVDKAYQLRISETGSPDPVVGIVPAIAGSAVSSVVIKASAGNLYGAYATCTSACWLMIFNATSAPANASTTAGTASGNLQDCVPIAAGQQGGVNYRPGPGEGFSVGITAVISSTACATLTASTVGFIHGDAR